MRLALPAFSGRLLQQRAGIALKRGLAQLAQPSRWLPALLIGLLLLFASLLVGVMLALTNVIAAALVSGLLLFVLAMLVPLPWLLALMLLLVYLVVGQLQYFARVDKAFWLPYLLGLLLYLRLLGYRLRQVRRQAVAEAGLGPLLGFGLFLVSAVAASLLNQVVPLQWFVAGKEYFFLWGVLLCLLARVVEPEVLERWSRFVVPMLALQILAVAYQRFIVVPQRGGASAFDAVVGLFGGDPDGGGASGAMAVFSMVVLGFVLEAWRSKAMRGRQVALIALLALTPLLMAEVKIVLLLLPFVLFFVYGRGMLGRPLASIAVFVAGFFFLIALLALYQQQFTEDPAKRQMSLPEFAALIVERNTEDKLVSSFGEMGRIPALRYWWRQELERPGPQTLIGYGVGATRVGSLAVGDLVRKHRLRLGRSTLAVYLWEVGLIGSAAIIGGVAASALLAFRTARRVAPDQAWRLRGCGIGLLLLLITFPYNTDFVEVAQIQLLFMLMAGYAIALHRRGPRSA